MEEIKKDLNKIIEEHLPKQLGETLQKRFNELENVEDKLATTQKHNDTLNEIIDKKNKEIAQLSGDKESLEHSLAEYMNRENNLLQRENDVRFVELERNLTLERLKDLKEITSTVFKNSTVRKNIFVNENNNKIQSCNHDHNGNPILDDQKTKSIEETTTEED